MTDTLSPDTPYLPAIENPISDVDLAFGAADKWDTILPPFEQLPASYQQCDSRVHESVRFIDDMFFRGGHLIEADTRDGVTEEQAHAAFRAFRAVLGSFGPSHHHKVGGLAFILDSFFTSLTWETDASQSAAEAQQKEEPDAGSDAG